MRDAVQRYVVFAVCVCCLVSYHACTHHACPVAGRCRRRDRAFREGGVIPWLNSGLKRFHLIRLRGSHGLRSPSRLYLKGGFRSCEISRNSNFYGSRARNFALAPGCFPDSLGLVPDQQLFKPGASERQLCMPGALPGQTLSTLRLWERRLACTSLPRRSEPLRGEKATKASRNTRGAPEAPRSQPLLLVASFPLKPVLLHRLLAVG